MKKLSSKELEEYQSWERKKFGATYQEILEEEAKKHRTDVQSFLASEAGKKRLIEIDKSLRVLLEKEKRLNAITCGSPGLGKRKS